MIKNVVIYGVGPYAEVFFYDLVQYGKNNFLPIAFTVDEQYMESANFCGLPVVAFENVENFYPPDKFEMFVICGYTRMRNRREMFNKAQQKGYIFPNYVSSKARVEGKLNIGCNNIVLAGAEIGHDGIMGNNNFINQNCYLAHNFEIGNDNIFSAGCIIGGFSKIGDLNFFGFSVISSGFRKVGNENLIGMGSVLTKNVANFSKVYGNPARVISYHYDTGVVIKESKDGEHYKYKDKVLEDMKNSITK